MFQRRQAAIAAILAACAIALAASNASAVSETTRPGGTARLIGTVWFEGGGVAVVCKMTFTLSWLTGPITIARGNQMASVTRIEWRECAGGNIETVLELPYRLIVNDSLPTVASLTTTNATGILYDMTWFKIKFSMIGSFVNCLYDGQPGLLKTMTATARGEHVYSMRTFTLLSGFALLLHLGAFGCPSSLQMIGTLTQEPAMTLTLT